MLKIRKGSVAASAKKEVIKDNEFKGFYVKIPVDQYWKLQKHLDDLRINKLQWFTSLVRKLDEV